MKSGKSQERRHETHSCFRLQNDTVEHIASKIYTLGLPTIKIGKKKHKVTFRVEDELIKEIRLNIDNSLQNLSKRQCTPSFKRLNDLKKSLKAKTMKKS